MASESVGTGHNSRHRVWCLLNIEVNTAVDKHKIEKTPLETEWVNYKLTRVPVSSSSTAFFYIAPHALSESSLRRALELPIYAVVRPIRTQLLPSVPVGKRSHVIRIDFVREECVSYGLRHEFARSLLDVAPWVSLRFSRTVDLRGMFISQPQKGGVGVKYPSRLLIERAIEAIPGCRGCFIRNGMRLVDIDPSQHKKMKDVLARRDKRRQYWMFFPEDSHANGDTLANLLPRPLEGFALMRDDNRCVFKTTYKDTDVMRHMVTKGLVRAQHRQLCVKIGLDDIKYLLGRYDFIVKNNVEGMCGRRKKRKRETSAGNDDHVSTCKKRK